MSLTISYPGYPLEVLSNGFFPRVMIIFTALSRYDDDAPETIKVKGSKSKAPKQSNEQIFNKEE